MQKQRISITFGGGELVATFSAMLETESPCVGPRRLAEILEAVKATFKGEVLGVGGVVIDERGPSEVEGFQTCADVKVAKRRAHPAE